MQQLNLHSGGELVTLDQLAALETPPATETHHPIAHFDVVNMVKYALTYFGHEVVDEQYAIDKDGARFFGIMALKSPYGDYVDICGLRNSSDKTFPIGIAFGSRVHVCSNLAFSSDVVIKRRHTKNAKFALPSIVAEVIEPLANVRKAQALTYDRFKATSLDQRNADHLVMDMYRREVINLTRIADVVQAYEEPPHDWGDKTAWRMFNAATFALTGKVAENPKATGVLHDIIDGTCTRLAA